MENIVPLDIFVFVVGSLAAALITGVAGFAFGLIAAAIWLHALTPIQTTTLIVAYGLLVQSYAVWKLRHTLKASRLVPLILGSAIGVPFGIVVLRWVSPIHLRMAIGILLISSVSIISSDPSFPRSSGRDRERMPSLASSTA